LSGKCHLCDHELTIPTQQCSLHTEWQACT